MKLLYVVRSIGHLSYHESILDPLVRRGHSVELLFSEKWSRQNPHDRLEKFRGAHSGVTWAWMATSRAARAFVRTSRELRSFAAYLRRPEQAVFYLQRWRGYLPTLLQRLVDFAGVRRLLASRAAERLWQRLEEATPLVPEVVADLRRRAPEVVVVSPANMRFSEELEYLKAARALGIPTAISVLSWDNLSTKGLVQIQPNVVLAWNPMHAAEAAALHGVPRDRIVLTGAPFLDKWFLPRASEDDQRELQRQTALAADQAFVLYLGSSANIAKDESPLVIGLARALRQAADPRLRALTVLARPHGANQAPFKNIAEPNVKVWLRDQLLPDTEESFAAFSAAIRGAVAVLGLNTTGMVDAVLADRPVIALLPAEYRETNAAQAVHFKLLLDADMYERAATPEECVPLLAALADGDTRHEARRRFALEYVRPQGLERAAGLVAAETIELLAAGKTGREINALLAAPQAAEVA